METRTLTRRIDLFDKTVGNIRNSIKRIGNYILKADTNYDIAIKDVKYIYNPKTNKGYFAIEFKCMLCYDLNNEKIFHINDLDMWDEIPPLESWYTEKEYGEEYHSDIEQIKVFIKQLREW